MAKAFHCLCARLGRANCPHHNHLEQERMKLAIGKSVQRGGPTTITNDGHVDPGEETPKKVESKKKEEEVAPPDPPEGEEGEDLEEDPEIEEDEDLEEDSDDGDDEEDEDDPKAPWDLSIIRKLNEKSKGQPLRDYMRAQGLIAEDANVSDARAKALEMLKAK